MYICCCSQFLIFIFNTTRRIALEVCEFMIWLDKKKKEKKKSSMGLLKKKEELSTLLNDLN